VGLSHLSAQQIPVQPPVASTPGLPPAQQQTPISDTSTIKVNFPNSPIQAIIPFYTQLTGKKMILDSGLQGETLKIIAPKPLTKKEAVLFIEATLLLNGYAIIPWDEETVMLLHTAGGKSPSSQKLPVFNSIKDLPDGDAVVHFVMPLEYISPDEAEKAFQEVIKLHAYGNITPVANASAIIITESSNTIRSMFEIAQIIDVPPAETASEMIKLERSDVESIAEIINEIYEEKEKSESAPQTSQAVAQANNGQPANPNNNRAPAINANGSAATSDTNPTAAKVKVIPYRRTNHLLVIARPVDIATIKGLVQKLDQQADDSTFMKRKLKYMPVANFLPAAYKALAKDTDIQNEGGGEPSGASSGPRLRRSSNTPSTDANRSQSGSGFGQFGQNNSFGGGSGSFGSSADRSSLSLDDPDSAGAPETVVVGRTLLIGDPQSNSLIVSGSPEHIAMIDKLIETLDTRPQQIYISTLIGQLNLNDQTKFGFDFLRLLDDFTVRRTREVSVTRETTDPDGNTTTTDTTLTGNGATADGTATSVVNANTGTNATTNVINNATQLVTDTAGLLDIPLNFRDFNWNQLNWYGQIGNLGRYINVLEGKKNFKILSRPSVYTTNNQKAVISSGTRIAVPVNILSNGGFAGGVASTSASIDYRDVVLKLEVIPLINSDDEVTLQIAQINDNIVGSQTISNNTVPTLSTQEMTTTVTVKNGETIVLGGLITEQLGDDGRGVVFLRRIPVIKHLFGVTEKKLDRNELLIFIQPQIISPRDPLSKPNALEVGRTSILEETLKFGGETRPVRKAIPAP
jgi:type II secretion system protein D